MGFGTVPSAAARYEIGADYAGRIAEVGSLDDALSVATEHARKLDGAVAVLDTGQGFALFPADVSRVERGHGGEYGAKADLSELRGEDARLFSNGKLAALVDSDDVVANITQSSGSATAATSLLGHRGPDGFSDRTLFARSLEHGFGFASLEDALSAARLVSAGDAPAVAVLTTDAREVPWYHLRALSMEAPGFGSRREPFAASWESLDGSWRFHGFTSYDRRPLAVVDDAGVFDAEVSSSSPFTWYRFGSASGTVT